MIFKNKKKQNINIIKWKFSDKNRTNFIKKHQGPELEIFKIMFRKRLKTMFFYHKYCYVPYNFHNTANHSYNHT